MHVYSVVGSERFELCHPQNSEDFETFNLEINGERRRKTWKAPAMRFVKADEGVPLAESDSPWLGSNALIFRPRAVEALKEVLSEDGELLPLPCESEMLSIFNVTRVLEALDEEASNIVRFSSGKIMRITRHVFRPDIIGNSAAFKITNMRASPTFVTDRFVASWRSAKLRGLTFKQEWAPD